MELSVRLGRHNLMSELMQDIYLNKFMQVNVMHKFTDAVNSKRRQL
jgi:hypothetical protein